MVTVGDSIFNRTPVRACTLLLALPISPAMFSRYPRQGLIYQRPAPARGRSEGSQAGWLGMYQDVSEGYQAGWWASLPTRGRSRLAAHQRPAGFAFRGRPPAAGGPHRRFPGAQRRPASLAPHFKIRKPFAALGAGANDAGARKPVTCRPLNHAGRSRKTGPPGTPRGAT